MGDGGSHYLCVMVGALPVGDGGSQYLWVMAGVMSFDKLNNVSCQ